MDTSMSEPRASKRPSLSTRVQCVRSACGIEAWLVEDHERPLLTIDFGFRRTTSPAAREIPGAVLLMSSAIFEGAGDLAEEAFGLALSDASIDLGAMAQRDHVFGQMKCLKRDAARAFELLALGLSRPNFSDKTLLLQKEMLRAHLSQQLSQPMSVAYDAFLKNAFAPHPYGVTMLESMAHLSKLTRADVIDCYERMVTRQNAIIVVIGAIKAQELAQHLDEIFGRLPAGPAADVAPCAIGQLGTSISAEMASAQTGIVFGRPCIGYDEPDYSTARVIAHAFGGGDFGSRLVAELREKRGLCYSIHMGIDVSAGMSSLIGSTSMPNDKAAEACRAINDEIARLVDGGLSADAIEEARTFLVGSSRLRLTSSAAIAQTLFLIRLRNKEPARLDDSLAEISAVTEECVSRTLPRMFGDGALLVSMAGPARPN